MYGRVKLIDAAPGGLGTYAWQVNYSEESFTAGREVDVTPTTNGVGYIITQGEDKALAIQVKGAILHKAQHQQFTKFYKVSRDRTLILEDFEGQRFEVAITNYTPSRQRTIRNPRDPSIMFHYYTYTMDFFVFSILNGDWYIP